MITVSVCVNLIGMVTSLWVYDFDWMALRVVRSVYVGMRLK